MRTDMNTGAFFELEAWEKTYLQHHLPGFEALYVSEKLTEKTIGELADIEILSTFIYSQLSRSVLEKLPKLRLIATRSTGTDHIDMAYCSEKGITVKNVPVYGAHTVAEHTFALILALTRNLIPAVERTRHGNFSLAGLEGVDLFGKTIGVIGTGNIGKRVIAIAHGFGMQCRAFSRTEDQTLKEQYGVTYVPLPQLLAEADIITIHVPLTNETQHLINKENMQQCKKGSMLINTARGPIVETQAILTGLEQGILKGVGLDVLEEECTLKEERELLTEEFLQVCDLKTQLLNHVLLTRENVIVTPHMAFHSNEALRQILDTTIANIQTYQETKEHGST